MKRKFKLLGIVLSLMLLVGCSSKATSRTSTPGQLVINGDYILPPTTHGNPYTGGFIGGGVEPYLNDTLFVFAPSDREFIPHLAESYTIDKNNISIKLKADQKWSDGSAITADNVINSYYMWIGKRQIWEFLEKIEKVSENEIKFVFKVESPLMMNQLCDVRIAAHGTTFTDFAREAEAILQHRTWHPETNSYWYEESGAPLRDALNAKVDAYKPDVKEMVTSGGFYLENITTSEVLLKRNEHFREELQFETLKIQRVVTPETASAAMIDGSLDVHSGGMNRDLIEQVSGKIADFKEFYIPEHSQLSVVFNTSVFPASELEFRQAMAYLINREEVLPIAEVGSLPSEKSASGLPPALQEIYGLDKWASDNLNQFEYNPQKAEEILTNAGWTKNESGFWQNKDGQVAQFDFTLNNGWGSALVPGQSIYDSLITFGLDVTFKPMEGAAYDTHITSREHVVAIEFAPPSNILYNHPYGTYEQLYKGRTWLLGLQVDSNNQILLEDKDGNKVDVLALTNSLFFAKDDAEVQSITKQLMSITDHNVLFIPYLEKGFPIRTLKSDIDLGYQDGELAIDSKFSGVAETAFARLIIEGNLKSNK